MSVTTSPDASGRRARGCGLASGRARARSAPGRAADRAVLGRCGRREAERGLIDFVTIEDGLSLQSTRDDGPDHHWQVRGRLDAVLVAARVAPLTSRIGLVPTVVVTHTEPFHSPRRSRPSTTSVPGGRACGSGCQRARTRRPASGAASSRRLPPGDCAGPTRRGYLEPFGEAADYVESFGRPWDSSEDDAEIRDVATGRFVDRGKLHYIDWAGPRFQRQGAVHHPVAAAGPAGRQRAGAWTPSRTGWWPAAPTSGTSPPATPGTPRRSSREIRDGRRQRAGRTRRSPARRPLVYLDDDVVARGRPEGPPRRPGRRPVQQPRPHLRRDAGPAGRLCRTGRRAACPASGSGPPSSATISKRSPGAWCRAPAPGAFRGAYQAGTLRDRLGLPRPASRYAAA